VKYEIQLFFSLTFVVSISTGQNLQIHYDFAEDRRYFTSTLEMYKPDEKGATFWFVDFEYNQPGNKSASVGYWEFARYMNLSFMEGLSGTIQFNDGVSRWGPLGHVWLTGITYPVDLKITTLSTELLYRAAYGSKSHDGQLTFVFYVPLLNGKAHLTGYADIWTQDRFDDEGKETAVMSQPQLWYAVSSKLYVGGEARITKNFLPKDGWQFYATFALKWDME